MGYWNEFTQYIPSIGEWVFLKDGSEVLVSCLIDITKREDTTTDFLVTVLHKQAITKALRNCKPYDLSNGMLELCAATKEIKLDSVFGPAVSYNEIVLYDTKDKTKKGRFIGFEEMTLPNKKTFIGYYRLAGEDGWIAVSRTIERIENDGEKDKQEHDNN